MEGKLARICLDELRIDIAVSVSRLVFKYFDKKPAVFLIKVEKLTKNTKNCKGSNQESNIQATFLLFSYTIDHLYKSD